MRIAKLNGLGEDNEACEQLRDDAHHVGYIRQLAAHRGSDRLCEWAIGLTLRTGQPSIKEMVAGVKAMQVCGCSMHNVAPAYRLLL